VQAVALPEWTLPLKVPSSGVLKLGLHLLCPPQYSGHCVRKPAGDFRRGNVGGSKIEEHDGSEKNDVALVFMADIQVHEILCGLTVPRLVYQLFQKLIQLSLIYSCSHAITLLRFKCSCCDSKLLILMQVLPNVPFKLRLQPFADNVDDEPLEAVAAAVACSKSQAKIRNESGPVLKCGDEVVLACTIEDEYRNGISRAQWPHYQKAWRRLHDNTASANANNSDNNDTALADLQDLSSEDGPHKWWFLPVAAKFGAEEHDSSALMNIDWIKPTLYLKSTDEERGRNTAAKDDHGKGRDGPRTVELVPQKVSSTPYGWDLEGIRLGGRADGTLYKVILRDGANRLRASNVHVRFYPGVPDRVEINGRVVWQDVRSRWVPRRQTEVEGGLGKVVASTSLWTFEAKNGARLPTLTVQAFDAWNNPALTTHGSSIDGSKKCTTSREKRSKKEDYVGTDARVYPTVTVQICPLLPDPVLATPSRCKRTRTPRRLDDVEKDCKEEKIELVPMMAVEESRGRTARQKPSGK